VLIHAGAGGMAIQFAKHAGAVVFSTASAANHDYVRGLGADHLIDYRSEDFVDAVKTIEPAGVDLAYVTASEVIEQSLRAVRRGGRLVSIVEQPDADAAREQGVEAAFHFVEPSGVQLRQIASLIEAGTVKPLPIEEVPLDEAAKAHRKSEAGHIRGKIILRIAND
jgi:NADPH2:quinone reductase